jgi:hypothetical protein
MLYEGTVRRTGQTTFYSLDHNVEVPLALTGRPRITAVATLVIRQSS